MTKAPITNEQKVLLRRSMKHPILLTLGADGESYAYSDGADANLRTVTSCIRSGLLVGSGDGLLPGYSQSYSPSADALKRI